MLKTVYGLLFLLLSQYLLTSRALGSNLVCYYNADGSEREGNSIFFQ